MNEMARRCTMEGLERAPSMDSTAVKGGAPRQDRIEDRVRQGTMK